MTNGRPDSQCFVTIVFGSASLHTTVYMTEEEVKEEEGQNESGEIWTAIVLVGCVLALRGPTTPQPLVDKEGNILLW